MVTNVSAKPHLVIICYPNDWHWVLSYEYVNGLVEKDQFVEVLDLSLAGENLLREFLRTFTQKKKFIHSIRKIFKGNFHCRITSINYKDNLYYLHRKHKFPEFIDGSGIEFKTIYPSLVEICESLKIDSMAYKKKVTAEYNKALAVRSYLKRVDFRRYETIATVNGRFTKNFEVAEKARNELGNLKLIEFGSSKNKMQVYDISPHSMMERKHHLDELTKQTPPGLIRQSAEKYFDLRRNIDPSSGVSWTEGMISGLVPEEWEQKKILTMYSSSQREFVGVQDEISTPNFKSQIEAFEAVMRIMESSRDWILVLRRHPSRKKSGIDEEENYWNELLSSGNLHVIPPDSRIDSYELGMKSEIVCHFNSSIGPELIYLGHPRVITLGPTFWSHLAPASHISTVKGLQKYLCDPIQVTRKTDVYSWGFFMNEFGSEFKRTSWNSDKKKWTIKPS